MSEVSLQDWKTYSEVYAFLGNSLLKPLSQTEKVGLDAEFWAAFPTFDCPEVKAALAACAAYACAAHELDYDQALQNVCVEYTKLFIGPPSPAAAPWETMYKGGNETVGFGEATFQMRAALKGLGLVLSNENNQYEDHMGIELLYLAELCARRAGDCARGANDCAGAVNDCAGETSDCADAGNDAIAQFLAEHPLSWIDAFKERVDRLYPKGYYSALIGLAGSFLNLQMRTLRPSA